MTQMRDNKIPFGKTAEEIVAECVDAYDFPVCFGFPAGHIDDNRALVMGGWMGMGMEMEIGNWTLRQAQGSE
jgi:muramoyltetrapeptide carboxypeptidase